jgi:hypothetical protein
MEGLKQLTAAASLLLAAYGASAAAQTQVLPRGGDAAPEPVRLLLGAWDLELTGASRMCTLTFAAEETAGGRQLRFPAICRRALPILGDVASWTVSPEGQPRLNDASGKAVITFGKPTGDRLLRGQGTDGKSYALDPKSYPRYASRAPSSAAAANAQAAQRRTPVDPATMPAPETVPGRYVMMRQQNREACRIELAPGPAAPAGQAPARFEGSCSDTGLMIFDPAGWRYAAGRLVLVARKGHSVEFVFENGQWRKDPPVGAPLMLRKAPQ